MTATLIALISVAIIQGSTGLCGQGGVDPGADPIMQDLFAAPADSMVFIKANCPCFCSSEENDLFVFQTRRNGEILQGWRIEDVADVSMPRRNEVVAINKLPPDDDGNPNHNTLKTVYVVSGRKMTSKDGNAVGLTKDEALRWAPSVADFSIKQKSVRVHQQSLDLFKRKKFDSAIGLLLPMRGELEANRKAEILNDLGFFLEQANRPAEAIPVLEKVVEFDPSRTPAYLNLADACQKAGDKAKAKTNYQKYVAQMEKAGKGAKVPARVRAALKP